MQLGFFFGSVVHVICHEGAWARVEGNIHWIVVVHILHTAKEKGGVLSP